MSNPLNIPPVKGLVLAGGHSTRMGKDKGLLLWHGKPQREYLVGLLELAGLSTFISCRPDQVSELSDFKLIVDRVAEQGPLGAIHSAFLEYPYDAWLVVACDMPLLNIETINFLLENRRPGDLSTAFRAPAFSDGSPDPLFAIWEPGIATIVEMRLKENLRCARRTLLEAGVHILEAPESRVLSNVNTPEQQSALISQNSTS